MHNPANNVVQSELFRQSCLVGGEWINARSGESTAVDNPADGTVIGHVPKLSAAEVEAAIDGAEAAFQKWRSQTAQDRANYLYRWYELMLQHQEELAAIMTMEQGKPLAEAQAEVAYGASYIRWFAEEAPRLYGDIIPAKKAGQTVLVRRQPVGVCACITPWNFPIAMLARKAGAALAAGCTVIAKPAEATPFSALAIAELAQRAGIPAGVFNVVTGQASVIGDAFTGSVKVKKISFTGSTEVGQLLLKKSATHLQKMSLELGGNAPFLVFDDADLDLAVAGLIAAKFRNSGQTCICVNRLFIQRGVYEAFLARLQRAMEEKLVVGDGFRPEVTQGPLINKTAVNKFRQHLDDALAKGAKLVTGGQPEEGNFVRPTLLRDARPDMLYCQEETFAPLLAAMPFDDEEQVIAMANDARHGLAGYFYSRDLGRVMRVSEALEVGMVGVNDTALSNAAAPFGGVKQSGFGREGSKYGIDDYVVVKYILLSYD